MYIRRYSNAFAGAAEFETSVEQEEDHGALLVVLFFAAHIPLALLMQYGSSILTVLHALATVGLGVKWALEGDRLERVAYVGAYITGAEVLWRMTNDRLFWETGKYAMVLIFAIAILRSRRGRVPAIPAAYFLLLLPSAVLTFGEFDFTDARKQISFNLSGPLALMISASFFWNMRLSSAQRQRVFLALAAPIVGIAAIALVGIVLAPSIAFTTESNPATSGGYGPNQVSAVLGLGALMLWLCMQEARIQPWFRWVLFAGVVWLGAQSAITFSRGGVYAAGLGAVLASLYLVRDRRLRGRLVAVPICLLLIGQFVIWPRLDQFTGGTLSTRFQETDTTHRSDISESDFDTWSHHFLMGVGPGVSRLERRDGRVTHTEFTRLVSEHGAFGALALLLLVFGAARSLLRKATPTQKGLIASMFGWSTLFMANSAMRLLAPCFTFGLAFSMAQEAADDEDAPAPEPTSARPERNLVSGARAMLGRD